MATGKGDGGRRRGNVPGNGNWGWQWGKAMGMAKGNGLHQKRYSVETFRKIPIILMDTYHV